MSSRIVIGKHAVRQTLASDQHIEKLYVRERQKMNDDLKRLIDTAKKQRIQVQWLEPYRFDQQFLVNIKELHALPIHLIKPVSRILLQISQALY